jgi:hypothetical protein
MTLRTAVAAVTLALATAPSAASAATITTDQPCYPADGVQVGFTLGGFAPGASTSIYGGFDNGYQGTITTGADGAFAGQFPAGTLGDQTRVTLPLSATADDGSATAATTCLLAARTISMSPSKARPGSKVQFKARGFVGGTTLYAHYAYSKSDVKKVHVKTVKLGTLTGPCGDLDAKKVKQLPLNKPKKGVYEIQFDTSKAYKRQQGAYVERTVFVG